MLVSLQAVYALLSSIVWIRDSLQLRNPGWTVWPILGQPAVMIVAATALWFGAARFGPETRDEQEVPMTNQAAFGVAILGVSAFMISTHLSGFINFLWLSIRPETSLDERPHYWADVTVVIASAAILPFGWRLAAGYGSAKAPGPNEGEA